MKRPHLAYALIASAALAACSGNAGGALPAPGAAPLATTVASRQPQADQKICPTVGTVISRAKATAKVVAGTAFIGSSPSVRWRIDYSGLTKDESDHLPTWHPALLACRTSMKPLGRVSIVAFANGSNCTNNVCTAYEEYTVRLTATGTLPGGRPMYQMVRFSPRPNHTYKFLDAVVWHVKKLP